MERSLIEKSRSSTKIDWISRERVLNIRPGESSRDQQRNNPVLACALSLRTGDDEDQVSNYLERVFLSLGIKRRLYSEYNETLLEGRINASF
ncbi:hypothetical protein DRN52_06155 [Thermococci archaeon]|nr:MAG: hypothetical protein DRN52_06155 [Thermococci archaeon]